MTVGSFGNASAAAGGANASAAAGSGVTVTEAYGDASAGLDQYALSDEKAEQAFLSDDDLVWVIATLEGDSLLDVAREKNLSIDEFALTREGIALSDRLVAEQDGVVRSLGSIVKAKKYNYTSVFNGVAMQIRYGDLEKVESNRKISNVIVSDTYTVPEAVTENVVNVWEETGIYKSENVTDFTGQGTIVAILDTGLDYTHSAFAMRNFPTLDTDRLAFSRDYVAGKISDLTATALSAEQSVSLTIDDLYLSDKVPYAYDYADSDANVYPVNDHGTHVAGIIGGKDDVITGVALNAQLAIMKVFGDRDAGAETVDILAALSDAVVLGVDAINMSLGSSCGFSREEDDAYVNEIYDSIKEAGICLVVAASNDYSSAYNSKWGNTNLASNPDSGTVGSPASYEASLAVASISGVKTSYLVADGEQDIYFKESAKANGDSKNFVNELLGDKDSATYDYVVVPGIGSDANYSGIDVAGKIAVVKRGSSTFEQKIDSAAEHGAIGVVIYNNVSGTISMSVGKSTIPACSVTMDMGKYLEGKGSGKFYVSKTNLAGPFMSEFSSWGVLPNLELKPDITAHGGDIYSAVREGYDHYSGTSMACPNMAGAIILIRQYVKERYPELSPYEVTELTYRLVMSTATIAYNEVGNPYSPRKQGAGLADIGKAVNSGAYLYVEGENKTKLSLGDDPDRDGVYTLKFSLKNISENALSYQINPIVMTETMSSDEVTVAETAYMLKDCSISSTIKTVDGVGGTINGDTVTVLGLSDVELTVEIRLSDAAKKYLNKNFVNGMYVEGFVELISQNKDAINLNIPYLAFYGDWTDAPMLDVTQYEEGASAEDPSVLEEDKLTADVIGSIPLGEFRINEGNGVYSEAYWGLGLTGYNLADGYEKPAAIEDKASLTQNLDGSFSLRGISAGLLRGAKRTEMSIKDAYTGEVVFTKTTYNSRKAYGASGSGGMVDVNFNIAELGLANNKKYTFEMECFLDVEGEQSPSRNTFSFSFYIDNEAPVLIPDETVIKYDTDSTTGKITRRYLELAFYDNHYIQGFFLSSYESVNADGSFVNGESVFSGMVPTPEFTRGTINKYKLDITQYWNQIQAKGGNLYIQVVDYAKNSAGYYLSLNDTVAEIESISFKETTGTDDDGNPIYRGYSIRPNGQVDLGRYLIVEPRNVVTEPVTWTSSDPSVATVVDGVVTGVKAGTTTITASGGTDANGNPYSASLVITVAGEALDDIAITGITLSDTALNLLVGETRELTATVTPYNTTIDYEIEWICNDSRVRIDYTDDPQTIRVTALETTYDTKTSSHPTSITIGARIKNTRIQTNCSILVKYEYEMEGRYLKKYNGRGDENGVVTIPDDIGIVNIYDYAFINNQYIKKIIIPEGVEEIMEAAIYGCDNLEEVVLPESCTKLDKWSLAWNPKLSKVNLENVVSIGELAFYNSQSLEEVDLSHVAAIGARAFGFCQKLRSVDISNLKAMGLQAFVACTALTEIKTGPYTPIGEYAFVNCSALSSVELNGPSIGEYAFAQSGVTEVQINGNVTEIGQYAFAYCTGLNAVNFRGTVDIIGKAAFNGASITALKLPNGLKTLGDLAFANCSSLRSVTASADTQLTDVGLAPFYECRYLKTFEVEAGSKYLEAQNGILYDKGMKTLLLFPYASTYAQFRFSVPESVIAIGPYAFSGISNLSTVDFANVEIVGEGAFYVSGLSSMTGTDNIRVIGDMAFLQTELKQVVIPANTEVIGSSAFAYTGASLSNPTKYTLIIPESVKEMGTGAFSYCTGIVGFDNRSHLQEIPAGTFANCTALISVTGNMFGEAVSVGELVFSGCTSLTTVNFTGSQIRTIGSGAFQSCSKLQTVTLPETLTEIAPYLFAQAGIGSIVLPETVTEIGEYAFYGTNLTKLISQTGGKTEESFGNVRSVGEYAFANTKLTVVNAPALETVSGYAFAFPYDAADDAKTLTAVYLPRVKSIGAFAFANAVNLKSEGANGASTLDIASVEQIGTFAFYQATALKNVSVPNAVVIAAGAFYECINLESVRMDSVVAIGEQAFFGTSIQSLQLPASLESITVKAFAGMEKLTKIAVDAANTVYFAEENGVVYRYLPNDKFEAVCYPQGRTDAEITLRNSTVRIEAYAFADNTSVETVNAPFTLKSIGSGAFFGATNLKTLNLKCVVAPILESEYSETLGFTYNNFIVGYGDELSLKVNTPTNAQGYDSMLWSKYVGETTPDESIGIQAHEDTVQFIDTVNAIDLSALTADDATTINNLKRRYGLMDEDQQAYVSKELVAKLNQAVEIVQKLVDEKGDQNGDNNTPGDDNNGDGTIDNGENPGDGGCGSAVTGQWALGILLIGVAVLVLRKIRLTFGREERK